MIDAIDPAEDNRGPVEFKKHAAAVVLSRLLSVRGNELREKFDVRKNANKIESKW